MWANFLASGEGCVWRMALCCPTCGSRCDAADTPEQKEGEAGDGGDGDGPCADSRSPAARADRKAQTMRKFVALGATATDPAASGGGKAKEKREKFRALPQAQAAALLMGTCQETRSGHLLKAARCGDSMRVEALIEAGVEYVLGSTPHAPTRRRQR